jgi:iron complex transport system substrate-binding protein
VGAIASELVCEIGACGDIVATDVTSVYPPELMKETKSRLCNTTQRRGHFGAEAHAPGRDRWRRAGNGARPAEAERRQDCEIPVGIGLGDAAKRLEILGEFAGNALAAKNLSQKMRADVTKLSHQKKSKRPAKVLFIYARGAQTLLAMGANTTAHELIELAGAANAFDAEGAKPVNAEAIAASQADIVLIPEGSLAGLGGAEALQKIPGLAQTPAGRKRRLVTLEDSLLAGMGPRTAAAARTLRSKIAEAMQK